MKITFLGTGTSQGVPVIGCHCQVCKSGDNRDKRLRSSVLVSVEPYNILIDAGPDFRQQMLSNQVDQLHAILLTHEHNDHIIGMDDIRPYNFRQKYDMPIYGLERVLNDVKSKFTYVFHDAPYPGAPRLLLNEVKAGLSFSILDKIEIKTLSIMHGTLPILGYRLGNFAYVTDASEIAEETLLKLQNLDVLVINSLQFRKHYSHFTYSEAVAMAQQINAKTTYFTHMSHEMGTHSDLLNICPENIFPAYDGLVVDV